jgi:hypothetical protein
MMIPNLDHPEPMPVRDIRRLLCFSIYIGYTSNIAPLSPNAVLRGEFYLGELKRGDLVMEISTIYRPNMDVARLGWLFSEQPEFIHTEEEWANPDVQKEWEGERPTGKRLRLVSAFDGTEHRWENYQFIRVPKEFDAGITLVRDAKIQFPL